MKYLGQKVFYQKVVKKYKNPILKSLVIVNTTII